MTIPDAKSLFGQKFYADDQTEQVFGIRPQHIPLPGDWTPKDYELHAEAGHMLICYPNRLQNLEPLTFEEMAKRALVSVSVSKDLLWHDQFTDKGELVISDWNWLQRDPLLKNGMPRSGWQFVSPNVLAETNDMDFIGQTDILMKHMEQLLHHALPLALWDAKMKWEGYEREVANQLHYVLGNDVGAAYFLSSLDIVRLLREPVQNTFFRYLIVHGCTGEKLFKDIYSWSSSSSSGGRLVFFGAEDLSGANVNGNPPVSSHPRLCAVASRMGF